MNYDSNAYDWRAILAPGTEIQIHEGGQLAANRVHQTPQTVTIVGKSDMEISEGDPHLPEGFYGLPASVEVRGLGRDEEEPSTMHLDTIYVIESLQRGDSHVAEK